MAWLDGSALLNDTPADATPAFHALGRKEGIEEEQ